ncbi:MAG: LpxD N-terminal domain-containing protein, partial [Bryobacteraceae bacterium]
MNDPLFLRRSGGLTLEEVAALIGAEPPSAAARAQRIVDVAALDRASPSDLSFLDNRNYASAAGATHACACITTAALAKLLPAPVVALVVREPYRAFVTVARKLFPQALRPSPLYEAGIAAGAHVHPSARLEIGATVEPAAVVGP